MTDVRVGRYLAVTLGGATADVAERVTAMCERLLCNGVIEEFRFSLRDEAGSEPAG